MFKTARIKLTLYYLSVIMVISIFFSIIVYRSLTFELTRIENAQRLRRPNPVFVIDPEVIIEAKSRVFFSLLSINTLILFVSGVSGYFLAGKTLEPIAKMVEEQKDFVSNASHELRTPLSALKTQIEVGLRDKKLSLKNAKEILNSSLDDVNRMTNLANYLLRLSKYQTQKDRNNFKEVDLSEVVKTVVSKNKKVKLELNKVIVSGDKDSLTELVAILVDNATKYGEDKEVEMTLKGKTLSVADSGIGISKDDLLHIFDRFFRSDRARGKDGYGLGLSIAKQIADNHNAKITVDSKLGRGSTFKVIFS